MIKEDAPVSLSSSASSVSVSASAPSSSIVGNSTVAESPNNNEISEPEVPLQSEAFLTAQSIFSTIIKSKSTERISCLVNTVLSLVTTILTAIHLRKIHYSLQHPDADMLDQNENLINRSERTDLENSYGTHHRNIYFNDQLQASGRGGIGSPGSSRHSEG